MAFLWTETNKGCALVRGCGREQIHSVKVKLFWYWRLNTQCKHRQAQHTQMHTIVIIVLVQVMLFYFIIVGIKCIRLSLPENGLSLIIEPVIMDSQIEATAHYSCDVNHTLHGSNTRTCLESQMWTGEAPLCGKSLQFHTRTHS